MIRSTARIAALGATALFAAAIPSVATEALPSLNPTIKAVTSEFDQIPAERKAELAKIADYVRAKVTAGAPVKLTFICTHNSRRSHLSQIWTQTAAAHYGIPRVETSSGGTEATACNPRTVAALKRAGFSIDSDGAEKNPVYTVRYAKDADPLKAFSKVYSEGGNPKEGYLAVMVCNHADENCPLVHGSDSRVAIPFVDPKVSDGTDKEAATYDERCHQIAREMFYAMSLVTK